jgi:hypothetical protein
MRLMVSFSICNCFVSNENNYNEMSLLFHYQGRSLKFYRKVFWIISKILENFWWIDSVFIENSIFQKWCKNLTKFWKPQALPKGAYWILRLNSLFWRIWCVGKDMKRNRGIWNRGNCQKCKGAKCLGYRKKRVKYRNQRGLPRRIRRRKKRGFWTFLAIIEILYWGRSKEGR